MAAVNGIELCYETFGDPGGRPLLLVMGLGGPMIWWDEEFCWMLADRGFWVIRYDNRDSGRSTLMRGQAPLSSVYLGRTRRVPYRLEGMADDAVALLDRLEVPAAHVAGVSLGGMIGQILALRHRTRVRTLTSISSTTGNRRVGRASPHVLPMLLSGPPEGRTGYINYSVRMWRLIGSPGYPSDPHAVRDRAARTYDWGISRSGRVRQRTSPPSHPVIAPKRYAARTSPLSSSTVTPTP